MSKKRKAMMAGLLTEATLLGTWFAAGITGGHGSPPAMLFGLPGFIVHVTALSVARPLIDRVANELGMALGIGVRILVVSVLLCGLWTLLWLAFFLLRAMLSTADRGSSCNHAQDPAS